MCHRTRYKKSSKSRREILNDEQNHETACASEYGLHSNANSNDFTSAATALYVRWAMLVAKFEPTSPVSWSNYFAICKYAVAPTSFSICLICDTNESNAAAWTGIRSATDSSSPRPLQASPLSFTSTTACPCESGQQKCIRIPPSAWSGLKVPSSKSRESFVCDGNPLKPCANSESLSWLR